MQNMNLLKKKYPNVLKEVTKEFDPPTLTKETLVIDGLFGSGLNKPLTGGFAEVVRYINLSDATVVSIDLPSGLMTEDNTFNVKSNIVNADFTLTLGMKKLCMMMADNQQYLGEVQVLNIGLSREFIENTPTQCRIITEEEISALMKTRDDFAHKGVMGHALLVAGSRGMAGANAVAAFALAHSTPEHQCLAREIVQRLWDAEPPTGKYRYYEGMVYFLSMLHVSGKFEL